MLYLYLLPGQFINLSLTYYFIIFMLLVHILIFIELSASGFRALVSRTFYCNFFITILPIFQPHRQLVAPGKDMLLGWVNISCCISSLFVTSTILVNCVRLFF
jgi:hypothetical protein